MYASSEREDVCEGQLRERGSERSVRREREGAELDFHLVFALKRASYAKLSIDEEREREKREA